MIFGCSEPYRKRQLRSLTGVCPGPGLQDHLAKAYTGRAAGNASGGRHFRAQQRTSGAAIRRQRLDYATPTTTGRPEPKPRGSDTPMTSNPLHPYQAIIGQSQRRQHERTKPERADDTITTSIMPRMSELMPTSEPTPTRANDARIEPTIDLDARRNRQG